MKTYDIDGRTCWDCVYYYVDQVHDGPCVNCGLENPDEKYPRGFVPTAIPWTELET